jgi:hypothetical protein
MTTALHTPIATFQFPYLNRPDTKFDPTGPGSYKCNLLLDPNKEDHAAFIQRIKAETDAYVASVIAENPKAKRLIPSSPLVDELDDNGNETGKVIFKASCKAGGTRKDGSPWTRVVPLFDAKGNKVQVSPSGGTLGRLAVTLAGYFNGAKMGMSARLEGAQIIKLVQGGAGGGVSFGAVEGGFTADPDEVSPTLTADDF